MIEKELKKYKKYKWTNNEDFFCLAIYLNCAFVAFVALPLSLFLTTPYVENNENLILSSIIYVFGHILFSLIYVMGVPYITFKYFNSKIPKKNLNLIQEIVELEKKLEINEVYFKELYNEIDLILNNGKEVVLEKLPAYQKLLKVPVKLKNEELKSILKAEPELIRNQININDYLINSVSEYNEKLNELTYIINLKNQELILNKGK